MTYPPQQPGPYGQQGSWGPPPDQFPPPAPPRTPPWLAGDQHGFPSFEPDRKKPRTGLVAALVVGTLVLGGGGVGLWMLLGADDTAAAGGDGGDPRRVAQEYVRELEVTVNSELGDIDLSSMEPLACAADFDRMEREIDQAQAFARSGGAAATPAGSVDVGMKDFRSTEEAASFTLTQAVDGEQGPDQAMTVAREGGGWKVCGLYGSSAPASASAPASD